MTFEDTYLRRLERALNSRDGHHARVEIIKAGIPRYFPEAERILLESDGLSYAPDVVVVGFLPNDVNDTFDGLDAITTDASGYLRTREAAELGPWAIWSYQWCHLCRTALGGYVTWRTEHHNRPPDQDTYRADGGHEKDWRRVEEEYARMAALSRSAGARLVILNIPQRGPWPEFRRYPAVRL